LASQHILCLGANMNGDLKWFGRSGVPGLGVSVEHPNNYFSALRHWDEAASSDMEQVTDVTAQAKNQKTSIGEKIVSMFQLKRRNTVKETSEKTTNIQNSAKVQIKRSQSMVTPTRNKLGARDKEAGDKKSVTTTKVNLGPLPINLDSDKQYFCDKRQNVPLKPNNTSYVCQNCNIICVNNNIASKPSIKRSVSYQQRGKSKKEYKKNGLQRRETVLVSSNLLELSPPNDKTVFKAPKFARPSSDFSQDENQPQSRLSTIGTQTEDHYDYAYSSMVPPSKLMNQSSYEEDTSGTENNIYEEIIPPDRRLFYSISKGRRENLELYKFADWDLEEKIKVKEPKTDKDNYIKPREIKSSLRKVKTKEHRSVTFAGSDESFEDEKNERRLPDSRDKPSLHRSKSVSVSSHTSSKRN